MVKELFEKVKVFLQWQDVKTGGIIFRAHSSFTTAVLITCSLLVTATEYVGSPILCITDHNPTHVINTFCWIKSTYTLPYNKDGNAPYQGITNDSGEKRKYHNYYQWVCFALFAQALLCYLPKLIWEYFEGGLLRSLVTGLKDTLMEKEERDDRRKVISKYLVEHMTLHKKYAIIYWACELLCLINIYLQLHFMNWFLSGEFMSYGWKVLGLSQLNQEERIDPMIHVFPRVTKCSFHKYGASGSIQTFDSLCILPLNVINEKTYIFIWFWFFILLSLLIILLISRILLFTCSNLRISLLYLYSNVIPRELCRIITEKVDFGDWWMLYLLRNNTNQLVFRDIIVSIAKDINEHQKHKNKADDFYISQLEITETRLYPYLEQ